MSGFFSLAFAIILAVIPECIELFIPNKNIPVKGFAISYQLIGGIMLGFFFMILAMYFERWRNEQKFKNSIINVIRQIKLINKKQLLDNKKFPIQELMVTIVNNFKDSLEIKKYLNRRASIDDPNKGTKIPCSICRENHHVNTGGACSNCKLNHGLWVGIED